ncbi:MAG TPA: methyltransferase domain-containing protein [Actinobacteria bacterium]|nr:methyltransferase domain-containing protein [Actinomycetota bacterium]
MSQADQERWDRRYSDGEYLPNRQPASFLSDCLPIIPVGRALVLACGAGRNALALAAAGFTVDAFDVSPVAIGLARADSERRGLDVNWQVVDLDEVTLERGEYDLITMFRYVNRALWSNLAGALAPNGWLMMELHLGTSREVSGPQSEGFRVGPQELLLAFAHLRIARYEERYEAAVPEEDSTALAHLLACKGDPGW